jgi:putative ABC transport system permease protein
MPDRSRWTADLRARLATLRLDPAREAEIVEELSLHLDERYAALRRGGADDAEARRVALDELRGPDTLARFMRPLRQSRVPEPIAIGTPPRRLLRDFGQDIRYAARMLRKEPTFAAAAVLTVALGIGANTAIFALVDATLLRPLPFPGAERLVMIWERTERTPRGRVAPLNLLDWRARSRTFEAIGAFVPNVGGMVMTGADGLPDTVPRQWVTAGYFDALGVKPIAGRTFRPSDDAGRVNGVVLSEGFWRSRFNADPGIVGRELRLDGGSWTVLGVAGPEAQLLRTSIWALMRIEGAPAAARS